MTEFIGRTVADAVAKGLQTLGLTEDEAEITILDEGRGGVFGLGSKEAIVDVSPRRPSPSTAGTEVSSLAEEAEVETHTEVELEEEEIEFETYDEIEIDLDNRSAVDRSALERDLDFEEDNVLAIGRDFLQVMLDHMDLIATVETSLEMDEDDEPTYLLNIAGGDLGALIGRRGETLDAIQYLVRLVVNRHTHTWPRLEVDVEHYKARRVQSLQRLASSMADRAAYEGRTVIMEAMPARERRLIHLALRDREDVYTESVGEGEHRKVTIIPLT